MKQFVKTNMVDKNKHIVIFKVRGKKFCDTCKKETFHKIKADLLSVSKNIICTKCNTLIGW